MAQVDVSKKSSNFFYLNLEQRGERGAAAATYCEIARNYNVPVIQKASHWVVTCERFVVPLQKVAYVSPGNNALNAGVEYGAAHALNIQNSLGCGFSVCNALGVAQTYHNIGGQGANSLHDLLQKLNGIAVVNAGVNLQWILTGGGRLTARWDWTNVYIVLSKTLSDIMDLGGDDGFGRTRAIGQATAGVTNVEGSSTIFDRVDRIDRVQLRIIGIPVKSEIVDTGDNATRTNVLADVCLDNDFKYEFTAQDHTGINVINPGYTVTETGRRNLIFDSRQRAKVTMLSFQDIPVTNIQVEAVAILKSGGEERIQIPPRSRFSVKLGFYSKT